MTLTLEILKEPSHSKNISLAKSQIHDGSTSEVVPYPTSLAAPSSRLPAASSLGITDSVRKTNVTDLSHQIDDHIGPTVKDMKDDDLNPDRINIDICVRKRERRESPQMSTTPSVDW